MTTAPTAPSAQEQRSPGTSRLRTVAAGGGLVVLALLGWAGYTWSHPTLLGNLTTVGETEQTFSPPNAHRTLYAGLTYPEVGAIGNETITLSSAKASVSTNSADSSVTIAVCDRVPGAPPVGTASDQTVGESCRSVHPVTDGTRLGLGDEQTSDYLLVVVTPTRAGSTQVDRVTYNYARGWKHLHQQGRETVPVRFTLKVER